MVTETEVVQLASFKSKLESNDISLIGKEIITTILEKNDEWNKLKDPSDPFNRFRQFETRNRKAEVFWKLDLDYREWGIKNISIKVTEVKITFDVVIYGSSVQEIRGIEWSSDSVEPFGRNQAKHGEWEMWVEKQDSEFRKVFPESLEINFNSKNIRVKF